MNDQQVDDREGGYPTENSQQWGLYNEHKRQVWQDIQASTDSFDQNLLTLSSAALTLSLAFIKDIVPFQNAFWVWALYVSWIAFSGSILVTVASFLVSAAAHRKQLDFLWQYHIQRDESYFNKKSGPSRALPWMTGAAGALFLAGFVLTLVFCISNIAALRRLPKMSETKRTVVQEGRAPVNMTPVPDERGRQPVGMTPAPKPAPAKQQAQTPQPPLKK